MLLRRPFCSYWTGYVYRDEALWPLEKPTWTAGAVLLAADALSNATPAALLFQNEGVSHRALPSAQDTKGANYSKIIE